MSNNNTAYSDIWGQWNEMDEAQRKSIGFQMLSFLKGASLSGVVEILENAPLNFKKAAWEAWSAEADLSGYLLGEVVALQDTETPTISYQIVKAWLKQADLSRANETQMAKMLSTLTMREDKVSLWEQWSKTVDLSGLHVMDFAKFLKLMYSDVAVAMNELWMKANGNNAAVQISHLSQSDNNTLDKCHLPNEIYKRWVSIRN